MDRHPDSVVAYKDDYIVWLEQQRDALRQRAFDRLDLMNLIGELELTVQSNKHEVHSRLRVIMLDLLKCEFQPQRQSRSWLRTLKVQREELEYLLDDSPSLRHLLPEFTLIDYRRAVNDAVRETGLQRTQLPGQNPYTVEQLLDPEFVPQKGDFT